MLFLEAQFGAANVSPIAEPKLPPQDTKPRPSADDTTTGGGASMDVSDDDDEDDVRARQQAELARLHRLGIPVPGVRIRVDKMEASVWLEGLEVECANRVFADRVRAVVERAVEVSAPLWG